jgi:hypothetical protein
MNENSDLESELSAWTETIRRSPPTTSREAVVDHDKRLALLDRALATLRSGAASTDLAVELSAWAAVEEDRGYSSLSKTLAQTAARLEPPTSSPTKEGVNE